VVPRRKVSFLPKWPKILPSVTQSPAQITLHTLYVILLLIYSIVH
jgi:hypothetical protein